MYATVCCEIDPTATSGAIPIIVTLEHVYILSHQREKRNLNRFNVLFRNNAYHSVHWAGLFSLAPNREKGIELFLTSTGTMPIIVSVGMFIFSCTKERKWNLNWKVLKCTSWTMPIIVSIGHVCFLLPQREKREFELIYLLTFLNWKVLTYTSGTMPIIVSVGHVCFLLHQREKKEVPFSMAMWNKELMQECFLKH